MAAIDESVYQELDESFEGLKKEAAAHPQAAPATPDAGDKALPSQNTLHAHFEKIIARVEELLSGVTRDADEPNWIKLIAMKTSLVYEEAKINLSFERHQVAKEQLVQSLTLLKGLEEHPFIAYLHKRIINHMAFTLSKMADYVSAKIILKEFSNVEFPPNVATYSTEELFAVGAPTNTDVKAKLHSIFINNLQMLSWIYSKMGLENDSAIIQHTILERELDYEECDPVDWAMRCTRVASLYLVRGQFVPARYYLSAAASALDRVEVALIEHPDLGRAQAELARGWIYYGLRLFDVSRSKDINKMCNTIFEENHPSTSTADPVPRFTLHEEPLSDAFKFKNSEVTLANVPAKMVTKINEARMLFQHTQMWLKRARVFYTLRDHPFIYVNCVLDLSELYRFLAFYEPELEVQYSVQKRRSDALETLSTILKEVRPQCYIAVSVELLRELAEVQIELMGINLKKMYKMHDPHENHETLKHRMEGVHDIQTKLEKMSHMFGGHPDYEMNATETSNDDVNIPGLDDNQVNSY